jgi:undecaprenyl-diphosphatase
VLIREPAPGYGYPSGHVMGATLIYGYAIVVAWRHAPRPGHAFAIAAALLAIGIIAWDRVYNGAHWPSDALGGGAIGVLLLAAAVALPLLPRLARPRGRRNERVETADRSTA